MPSIAEQLVETSRRVADMVVDYIGSNQERFDEAMDLAYKDEKTISMRAIWVVGIAVEKHPQLIQPHIKKLVKILPEIKIDAVKRIALKMLGTTPYPIDEMLFGELADIAFNFAGDPNQTIATRAFSIDILMQVSQKYPEINPELIAVLETVLPDGSNGLKNKCAKALKKLKKTALHIHKPL